MKYIKIFLILSSSFLLKAENHFELKKQLDIDIKNNYQLIQEKKDERVQASLKSLKVKPVSEKNKIFIENVLRSIGMDPAKINLWSSNFPGACAVGNNIIINERLGLLLNSAERTFFIAHEAMHIKYNHIDYGIIFSIYPDKYTWKDREQISKENERQADIEAAKALKSVNGGITGLKKAKIVSWILGLNFDHSHPAWDERIEYLRALGKSWEPENEDSQDNWFTRFYQWAWN